MTDLREVQNSGCCSSNSSCCAEPSPETHSPDLPVNAAPTPGSAGISRRNFLALTGTASIAMLFAALPRWAAGSGEVRTSGHLIPKQKKLPRDWSQRLWDDATETWSGNELHTIGMPVGGIGAGQIYFCGNGTLGLWEIFNEHARLPHGIESYVRRSIPKPVEHGLGVYWMQDGKPTGRRLDESGFTDVTFTNSHPIGQVNYAGDEPLEVQLEGFSPFIPLNAADSGLPLTFMIATVKNTGTSPLEVGTVSWLENPIGRKAVREGYDLMRKSAVVAGDDGARIAHSAEPAPAAGSSAPRETVTFQDFEQDSFGDWSIAGTAFGDAPTTGNLPTQQNVTDFEGKGFAGSFRQRDATTGRLTSPPFTIERRFINFKIGGGHHLGETGIVLLIDSKPVRTAAGKNQEKLDWRTWNVAAFEGQQAQLEIRDDHTAGWGHTQVDHIEFSDEARPEAGPSKATEFPDFGTLAWAVAEPLADPASAKPIFEAMQTLGVSTETTAEADGKAKAPVLGIATRAITIAPGESHEFVHALAWHFPNTVEPDPQVGHVYATRFRDASAVLDFALAERQRLVGDTRKWRDTYYDSTLPRWLLERAHLTSCCLATGTTMWWKNGRFWGFEGVTCCVGTCTHVYNYVQTVARLFPELERNIRENQDLKPGVGLEPSGLVGFRHDGKYAADGQCGTVLKVYREHQMSPDAEFLKRNWAATKKVLDYAIGQDGNGDGMLEGSQHNTYDVDFYGPNTFVGALYLAALRAGEAMALEMAEPEYAKKLSGIYEAGRRFTEEKLWNGEWFIQIVDLDKHPEHQYGPGCLSDQMFGQNWAHQLGLGYLYDPAKVKRALQSVWDYNWTPDLGPYNERYPAQRIFAAPAEAGLFNCTWPASGHLDNGVLYRDEVWTGVEYQVANHMVYEGMLDEAMSICRAVHERYTPARRNPYNEIECSDYYSRAMASWGMLLALSGFQYHGPKGELSFAPRVQNDNFRCVFNTAESWGNFEQKSDSSPHGNGMTWQLSVKHGTLKLKQLKLDVPGAALPGAQTVVQLDNQAVSGVQSQMTENTLTLEFTQGIEANPGQVLTVQLA